MARNIKSIYWDACAWISLIQDENVTLPNGNVEKRGQMCRAVLAEAEAKKIEIFTSAFTMAEVYKIAPASNIDTPDKLKSFFENDYFVIVELGRLVGEFARDLMQSGHRGLKPPDATHLASAAISDVDCMHTFDQKLLNLDNKIDKLDGTKLRISKPEISNVPLPLLELESDVAEEDVDVEDPLSDPSNEPEVAEDTNLTEEEIEKINATLEAQALPENTHGYEPPLNEDENATPAEPNQAK